MILQPPAIQAAWALLDELIAHGVRDVVLCPGSRSAPLAHAAAVREESGDIRLHVRIDERSAAFFALGIAKAYRADGIRQCAAVITTSGSAVANLHPAVLEAHHAHVPLVVLSADRPHEMRDTGANQTTHQPGIFGAAVRWECDPAAPTESAIDRDGQLWRELARTGIQWAFGTPSTHPGPVHFNLPFREPLNPAAPLNLEQILAPALPATVNGIEEAAVVTSAPQLVPARPVIIAGADAGPQAAALSQATGWPLIAEPGSGASGAASQVVAPNAVLRDAAVVQAISTAIVFGRPTLARPTQRLLAEPHVTVLTIADGERPFLDVSGRAAQVYPGIPANWLTPEPGSGTAATDGTDSTDWSAQWLLINQHTTGALRTRGDQNAASDAQRADMPLTGLRVAEQLFSALSADDALFIGASSAVREADDAQHLGPVTQLVSRGLSGIDGSVATALGIAATRGAQHRTYALLGDLTAIHDAGGWHVAPGEPEPNLTVIVLNDCGGAIFDTLEQGAWAREPGNAARYERIFGTPHRVQFDQLAAGLGVQYRQITSVTGLEEHLRERARGRWLIEIPISRAGRAEDRNQTTALITKALGFFTENLTNSQ